jgi:hypothetical protein
MGTIAQHYTGSAYHPLGGDATVNLNSGRLQVFLPTDPAIDSVTIDDATKYKLGADIAVIGNWGNENLHIRDADAGLIITITPDRAATLSLFDNTTPAGSWGVRVGDMDVTLGAL